MINTVHAALYDAEFADALYSKVIRALFGETVNRWTLTAVQACHPEVNAALRAKLDADARWLFAFREARNT